MGVGVRQSRVYSHGMRHDDMHGSDLSKWYMQIGNINNANISQVRSGCAAHWCSPSASSPTLPST